MPKDESFKNYVVEELLRNIDGVTARAMFGGYGIYRNGIFFALIADGRLYFKVDETNQSDYEKQGSKPFVYHSPNGEKMTMSYWELPSSVLDNPEEVPSWVEKSYHIAFTSKAKKKKSM